MGGDQGLSKDVGKSGSMHEEKKKTSRPRRSTESRSILPTVPEDSASRKRGIDESERSNTPTEQDDRTKRRKIERIPSVSEIKANNYIFDIVEKEKQEREKNQKIMIQKQQCLTKLTML